MLLVNVTDMTFCFQEDDMLVFHLYLAELFLSIFQSLYTLELITQAASDDEK